MPPKGRETRRATRSTQMRSTRAHPQGSPVALSWPQRKRKATPEVPNDEYLRSSKRRRPESASNLSDTERHLKEKADSFQDEALNHSDTEPSHDEALGGTQEETYIHSDINHTHNEGLTGPRTEYYDTEAIENHQADALIHSYVDQSQSDAITHSDIERSHSEALESPQEEAFNHCHYQSDNQRMDSSTAEAYASYQELSNDKALEDPRTETTSHSGHPHNEVPTHADIDLSDDEGRDHTQYETFNRFDMADNPHDKASLSISGSHSNVLASESPQTETQNFFGIEQSQNVASDANYVEGSRDMTSSFYNINHAHYEASVLSDTESAHREASIFSGSKGLAFETDQDESSAVNDIESPQDETSYLSDLDSPRDGTLAFHDREISQEKTSVVHDVEIHPEEATTPADAERAEDEVSVADSFHNRKTKWMRRFRLDASSRDNYLQPSNESQGSSQQRQSSLTIPYHTETQDISKPNQTDITEPVSLGVSQYTPASLLTKENIEQLQRDQRNFNSLANLGRPRYDDRPPSIYDEDIIDERYSMLQPARLVTRRATTRPPLAEQIQNPTTTVERLLPKKQYIEWNSDSKAMFVVQSKESDGSISTSKDSPCMTNFITIYSSSFSSSPFALGARSLTDVAVIDAVSASLDWFEKNPQHPVPTASEMQELLDQFHQPKQAERENHSGVQPSPPTRHVSQHNRKQRNRRPADAPSDHKAPKTPKKQQEASRSARGSLYLGHEDIFCDKENQESETEKIETNMKTDIESVSKDPLDSEQKRTLNAPQQNEPSSWASALSVSSIGNILRTPINFFSRRNRGAATDGRPGKATPATTQHQRLNHTSQAPATIAHPKADRTSKTHKSRDLRANHGSRTRSPIATYQFPTNGKPDGHLPLHLRGSTYDQLPPEWQAVSQHMKPPGHKEPEPVDNRAGYTDEFKELLKLAEITRAKRFKEEAAAAKAKKQLQVSDSSRKRPYHAYAADETNADHVSDTEFGQQTGGRSTYAFPSSSSSDEDSDEESPLKQRSSREEEAIGQRNESSSKKPRLDVDSVSHKQIGAVKNVSMTWGDEVPSEPEPPKTPFYATAPLGYPRDITPEEFGDPHQARPADPTFLPGFKPYAPRDTDLVRRELDESGVSHDIDAKKADDQLQRLFRARAEARRYLPKKRSPLWMIQNMSPEEKRMAWAGAFGAGWGGDITDPEVIDAVMAIPEDELTDYFADIGKENVAPIMTPLK